MIRTRFAPSPTGYLHVGGLRTALYSYLIAKQAGGKFLLRIEDTDRERFVEDGTSNIVKSLYWAGIIPDEGVTMKADGTISQIGDKGSYIQSERLELYQKYALELVEAGKAYYCFCTSERLAELRELQEKNKQPTGYDGACATISLADAKKRVVAGERHVIRLVMPKTGTTEVVDLIRGSVSFKNDLQEDFVALKSDGYPTYHLASVIDDHTMEISHVIRGEEWLSSVPKHIALYKAFGWDMPKFAHLSLLLNPDKTKLSKRQGDVAVADYQKKGYLPEALVNFVAFLGWNPGDEREIFSLDGLASAFSLEKVSKAGAVFNVEKLDWYNKEYIKAMSPGAFAEACLPWLLEAKVVTQDSFSNKEYRAWLEKALSLEKERVTTLAEIVPALSFVFTQPEFVKELLVWRKGTPEEVARILPEVRAVIAGVSDWSKAGIEQAVAKFIADKGYAVGSVLWPLRVSLSGQQNSPGPYEIAEVLGQEESLRRLDIALAK